MKFKKLYLPSEEVYSKRKEVAPYGCKFFPFRIDTFSEWAYVQESN